MKEWLRSIPAVHELQQNERFQDLKIKYKLDFDQLSKSLKLTLEESRKKILSGTWQGPEPGKVQFLDKLFDLLDQNLNQQFSFTIERIINATGTVLHTNLGRARLSEAAIEHVIETARNYSNLEYNLQEGERGSRHSHVETLIKGITGAEAAMVVNNNAAAVYLILRALSENKEVIVSRGQLVEIGGSFRISSIMKESGAKLIEVGTTNKTHLYDYEEAVSDETRMIMKVHTSNFKTIGFTKSVSSEELIHFTDQLENVLFYEDLGSGALYDFRKHGIGEEPIVSEIIEMGADLISFSGDKLLGGLQAGIIAGKKKWIDKLKKHQLARVVRVDKMTLAALEGTLMDYNKGISGANNIPTVRDLLITVNELMERTQQFIEELLEKSSFFEAKIMEGTSQVGGGTMPEVELPTILIALKHTTLTAEEMGRKLRAALKPAIITRIQKDELLLDLRTVNKEEEVLLLNALLSL
ncbi:L-seryl-tRNA(Sec) selenium transferase [Neobacillus sp. PS3-34]|uniref:L-seryl-tRNA(Sec) selenium transferase n=1 Tax=Neobacillus sp. PS3-34 TaxID=3070678 RepID=UPI0027E16679|nr:L-seryl-tRNA(Sec) selenium transferase [Neobacillus sp. PS3-34]WML48180.1 L-seryl-tRNA(Sec) selenium transferase [Neobacillus sp. PS3-34]